MAEITAGDKPGMPYHDEPLAICHLIGGANGLPWDRELTDEQIKAHVAKCIRVWHEIRRQLGYLPSVAPGITPLTG